MTFFFNLNSQGLNLDQTTSNLEAAQEVVTTIDITGAGIAIAIITIIIISNLRRLRNNNNEPDKPMKMWLSAVGVTEGDFVQFGFTDLLDKSGKNVWSLFIDNVDLRSQIVNIGGVPTTVFFYPGLQIHPLANFNQTWGSNPINWLAVPTSNNTMESLLIINIPSPSVSVWTVFIRDRNLKIMTGLITPRLIDPASVLVGPNNTRTIIIEGSPYLFYPPLAGKVYH